ncbi:flagellar protein FlgJ [Allopseudospirillum japonicum]|uniref:Peptidoglycan hydrolase FlgJ n=1 Tax=Allopseudospirillum japonicum TaxID=64971 RepID=A0A1H6TIM4_9GAMM|nr:flagellar assembly peptidoglycan hydrolase FlgJ [Allopseudospirillum japonicum]SEI78034.1 flagellar protein FlgJ [Allopseudospirillum japonicum]
MAIGKDFSQARVYSDMQGLDKLRRAAREDSPEALQEVARQFEAMFVQLLLKNARTSNEFLTKDTYLDSHQLRFYQGMYDEQMSLEIAGQGLGLADALVRQLGQQLDVKTEKTDTDQGFRTSIQEMLARGSQTPAVKYALRQAQQPQVPPEPLLDLQQAAIATGVWRPESTPEKRHLPATTSAQSQAASRPPLQAAAIDKQARFDSPDEFVQHLYPIAEQEAQKLGVDPRVILAQAALETGWGRYMISHPDGSNSFNLFGIKADQRWSGDQAVVSTLEYRSGVAQRERAAFRSYQSYAQSLADYVGFLQRNPRYQQALQVAEDPKAFTQGLQQAGYATDPSYAQKILRIMHSPVMRNALANLSTASNQG